MQNVIQLQWKQHEPKYIEVPLTALTADRRCPWAFLCLPPLPYALATSGAAWGAHLVYVCASRPSLSYYYW